MMHLIAMLGGPSCYHRLSDWNEAVDEFNKAALDEATRMAYLKKKVKSCARVATMAEVGITYALSLSMTY